MAKSAITQNSTPTAEYSHPVTSSLMNVKLRFHNDPRSTPTSTAQQNIPQLIVAPNLLTLSKFESGNNFEFRVVSSCISPAVPTSSINRGPYTPFCQLLGQLVHVSVSFPQKESPALTIKYFQNWSFCRKHPPRVSCSPRSQLHERPNLPPCERNS